MKSRRAGRRGLPRCRTTSLGIALGVLFAGGCIRDDVEKKFAVTFEAPATPGVGSGEAEFESFLPLVLFDFTLPASVTVDGQVTDGNGAPLVGADLTFVSKLTGMSLGSATTDGTGNYSVDMAPSAYDVWIDSGSATTGKLTMQHVVVPSGAPFTQNVAFPATVTLNGTVFEQLGASIPDATLEFTGRQTGAVISVVADGLGDFSADVPPDVYDVLVTPVGGAAATQLTEIFPTTVAAAGMQDFALTAGVMVTGTVRDDFGGALLESSEIEVLLPSGSPFVPPTSVVVNSVDGTYSIGPLPAGSASFRVKPPGDTGFPVQDLPISVLDGGPQVEDLSLLAGFLLTGNILQEDGLTPEELVNILPVPLDGSVPPLNVLTDAAGNYSVSLFPGEFDVSFRPEITNLQLPELQTLNITGDTLFDLNLTTGALLTGIVTEPGGVVPAEDVLVSMPDQFDAQGITDATGAYSFLAPLGTNDLALEALDGSFEGFALADVTGVDVVGATNLDFSLAFELLGATVVRGTVYEPDGTTPAIGVLITATDNDTGAVLGKMLTDTGGDYTLIVR
jgi:hypothetical protein